MVWKDQTTFEGQFDFNFANGPGKMTSASGDVYEGTFSNNKFYGKGVLKKKQSGKEYSGDWVNDMKHGQGVEVYGGV